MAETSLLRFARYVVDRDNEQLRLDNHPVRLTNKAFGVLRYLVEHPGQLVTKEALFAVVWPESIVSETTLTNCISEVRRALGDDPKQPRFIETVHRRGYRFLPSVATAPPVSGSRFQVSGQTPEQQETRNEKPETCLVGRETELAQLHNLFAKALSGQRQVVFVTGEAGIGKTALVDTFLQRLESRVQSPASDSRPGFSATAQTLDPRRRTLDTRPWISWGQCIEQYGTGEAYLPVLEALGRLGRGPQKAHLLSILNQYAPTWLAQLPALLSPAELEAIQRRIQGATRERMLREITEAFDMLTADHPLVVVLEDLHWSDPSTVETHDARPTP
jgi:DNA-binding winged helix-turn-helix (wHTH) protein